MSEKVASQSTGNFTGKMLIIIGYKPHKYVIKSVR